jgi:hypothetical protein
MAGNTNMADEKPSGGGNSFIVLVAAAVSAAYFVWQKPLLEGFRPTETLHQAHDDRGEQDVEARLWQDPLAAIQEQYEREKGKRTISQDHSINNARVYLQKSLVIGVMLPGGPYPEDSETRRRYRYAVLAALHTANYDPIDENHLGYFETTKNEPREIVAQTWEASVRFDLKLDGDKGKKLIPAFIPFEKFRNLNQKGVGSDISILWLNEDVLDAEQTPIESIRTLLCPLNLSNFGFAVIGPQYSQTLINMFKEVKDQKDARAPALIECPSKLAVLPIYNFGATAAEDILLSGSGFNDIDSLTKNLQRERIDYYRTISTDRDLVPVLLEELKQRGIDFKDLTASSHHVVLISEADTLYGRSLRDTIKNELLRAMPQAQPERVQLFSYFRGLDGQLPGLKLSTKTTNGEEASRSARGQESTDTEKTPLVNQKEVAQGQGQFDYVRRLADYIHRLDDELRRKGSGKIAGVGLLGSDVYDKQILIEAIKPELPEAVFFTTDLDALLLPHDKFRFTRNLIVASSYGLELAPDLQCDIPPFRSGYQSSIFLATRLAIRMNAAELGLPHASSGTMKNQRTTARLFQIGRSQVHALPTVPQSLLNNNATDGESCNSEKEIIDYSSIDPTEARLFPEIKSGSVIPIGLLIAILVLAIALMTSGWVRKLCFPRGNALADSWYDPVRPSLHPLIILVGVISAGVGLSAFWPFLAYWLTRRGLGEPMSLLEGISVWPTVTLRALSIVLGGWLVFYTLKCLKTDLDLRRNEMDLPEPCFRRWRGQSLVNRWCEMASLLWFRPDTEPHSNDGFKTFNSEQTLNDNVNNLDIQNNQFLRLWTTYSYYSQKRWRLARAAIAALAMVGLWYLLAKIFGDPNVPARGIFARYIYRGVTFIDVLVTLLVIFLVVDATLFSRSVVDRLTAVKSFWPKVSHLDRGDLQDWFDIRFIAHRTRCITQLIYFPFIMLALLIVSRSPIFDDYAFTPTLVIGQLIILTIIIGSVASLRNAAEQARKTALEHLSEKRLANHDKPETVSELDSLSTQIRDMQDGAFAPPLSQPIVKAVLLPLVTYGGTWLVQIYAMPGL